MDIEILCGVTGRGCIAPKSVGARAISRAKTLTSRDDPTHCASAK
ncbi:hypothetical protein NX871_05965 [Burkholderia thailandensis]|nr:hypothetical protein [Burkholderia thailandensis]MCS6469508.1 hypothetical protein [Burkholderia thailandensis]